MIDAFDQIPADHTYAQFGARSSPPPPSLTRSVRSTRVSTNWSPTQTSSVDRTPRVAYARLAAIIALQNGQHATALGHLEQAIELLPRSYSEAIGTRNDILMARVLGRARHPSGSSPSAWLLMSELGFFLQASRTAWCTGVALLELERPDDALRFLGWLKTSTISVNRYAHRIHEEFPRAAALLDSAEPVECSFDEIADAALAIADDLDDDR